MNVYNIGIKGTTKELEKVFDAIESQKEGAFNQYDKYDIEENGFIDIYYTGSSFTEIDHVDILTGRYAESYSFTKTMTPREFLGDNNIKIDGKIIELVEDLRSKLNRNDVFALTATASGGSFEKLYDELSDALRGVYVKSVERDVLEYVFGFTDSFPYAKKNPDLFKLRGLDSDGDFYYVFLDSYGRPKSTSNPVDAKLFISEEEAEEYKSNVTRIIKA